MICWPPAGCSIRCSGVSSWASAIITARRSIVQLRLELAESPVSAVALWELVGEEQRQTAMSVLAALIAQTVVPGAAGDERVSLGGAGPVGRDD
jgi:hypothetical protein